jgi:hypothetical protein
MGMDSLFDSILAAGIGYGWRVDAIILGGVLWSLAAGFGRLRPALVAIRN